MTTIRMFAFLAAVLITAFLLGVIMYSTTVPQSVHSVAGIHAGVSRQSTAD